MKDLGQLHHFLGVTVEPHQTGLLLHQHQYALDILERAGMTDCRPCSTPVDTQTKLSATLGGPVADPTAYRNLAGALQYHIFTRSDHTYAVQQICLRMHDPRESHLAALKRLLRYVHGTVDFGLVLHRSPSAELVVYTDADWAGCSETRRSTSGYDVFLNSNLPGRLSDSQLSVARVLRQRTGLLLTAWLRRPGFDSFTTRSPRAHSSTATTSASCNSPTRFSISRRSMWRLTCTSFETEWLLVMFGFFMYRPPHSSLTSSPRVFPHRPSRSFGPAST
jgi:hypothetical protein